MRRQNSNLNEDVILFLGECDIITLNNNHQIVLATRTILLKEDVLLTYQNPLTSVKQSRLSKTKPPINLQRLVNHQYEYRITALMRGRLLLGRRDEGVDAYLKELKVDRVQKENSIVAVINHEENYINGFVFSRQAVALDFYESLNAAIATQIYIQKLPEIIPFNPKIVNMLADTMNGRCSITPDDFAEGKQEEDEIKFVIDFLRGLQPQPLVNFRTLLCEMQLKFKIIDDFSRDYAVRFLVVFPDKVERVEMMGCDLTSNMASQVFSGLPPNNLYERLIRLQELNLSKNSLNDDVFTTITKLLKSSKKLQTIILNQNTITFQKQSIIVGFLSSIVNFRINLQLSHNGIHSAKHIAKYLLNAEGHLPLSQLDISYNPISPEELAALTKTYLFKLKQEGFEFKLHLTQLEFQEPSSFQFLKEEYRNKKPNTMAVPVIISKHVMRKKGKDIGSTEEQLNKSAKIEQLFRNYGIEVYRGNFYKLKQIRAGLVALGVQDEVIQGQVQKYNHQKQLQEYMIIRKMQSCLNFEVEPRQLLAQLNQTLRFCRRKGLTGMVFNVMACIKAKIQAHLEKSISENNLGRVYRQVLYTRKGRFKAFYQQIFQEDYVFNINLPSLLNMSWKDIMKEERNSIKSESLSSFMAYHYMLAQKIDKPHLFLLENIISDPRMTALKIARFEKDSIIEIFQKIRIKKSFLTIPDEKASFVSTYGIQTYKFSQSFIESGVSSSTYTGILSCAQIQPDQEKLVLAFIQISKNFLKYLYYTPTQLSEQTMIYLNSIVTHLGNLQNEVQNPLKLILAEQLLVHMMTFFDSTRYQPLKPGMLTATCEFIARRVALGEDLLKRVAAFVMKTEGGAEGELKLHQAPPGDPWEGKIDWKIADLQILRSLLLKRGKIQVKVADIAHPELLVTFEIDQINTVVDLWGEVKRDVVKFNEFTNVSQANIDYYWLSAMKGGSLRLLPSFEHIGKLIFDQGFDGKFYLRRVVYRPQEHSLDYLNKTKYEQLLAIYQQAKQSFRLSASLYLSAEAIVQAIILSIWADILLTDELMLGDLRRQADEESQNKYTLQRERVVNDCISKLYSKYVPVGFTLDQAGRNKVIFDTKSKQMGGAPKNINDSIKETILKMIKTVGIAAYTTTIYSQNDKYAFYINNHNLIFMDKTEPQAKIIQAKFRNIIWFQLTAEGDSPILKFEVADEPQANGEQMTLHRFSIQGDSLWIGQCFALITQVARNRLSYPPQLLFANEDESGHISECPIKAINSSLLYFPLLNLQKYFSFTLSRKQEVPALVAIPPPAVQNAPAQIKDPNPQPPAQNHPPLPENNPNLLGPERIKSIRQSKANSDKNMQIQEIIKSADNKQSEEEEVITSRRSSHGRKNTSHQRKSRNK